MSDNIIKKIQEANSEGRKALIPFLPAGFPDKKRFWQEIYGLDQNGADIIEIGIPFSDPIADGPVVEQASQECLNQGVNLGWVFETLYKNQKNIQAKIVLMGYVNPFMQYDWELLARDAASCRVSGLIVPDLPLEESKDIEQILNNHNLKLIRLIGLNTSADRMKLYAQRAQGFIYFVSVLGTTGDRNGLSINLQQVLSQAKKFFTLPVALGFGLSNPKQLSGINEYIDAVIFGSSLIKHIKEGKSGKEFMLRWRH